MTEEFDYTENNLCFVTEEEIVKGDSCRFTYEYDAWVSEDGQKMIDEWVQSGMQTENMDWKIIHTEWYAQDEEEATMIDENMGFYDD